MARFPRRLRLGLIGAGPWGRNYIRTLAGRSDCVLARLASRNPAAARLAGPDCAVTPDWRGLIGSGGLDGVIIAAPSRMHSMMALEAIEAGMAVLVEKPLTMDPVSALKLREAAARRKVFVLVDHVHLFAPAWEVLKKRGAALGVPRLVHSASGAPGPFRPDTPPLWDYGPHDVAMVLDLLGAAPVEVAAEREASRHTREGYGEIVRIQLDFPGGVLAHIRVGNLMPSKLRRFDAEYAETSLVYDDQARHKLQIVPRYGGSPETIHHAATPPLTRVVDAFVQGARGGATDLSGLDLAVRVVETLFRCEEALR